MKKSFLIRRATVKDSGHIKSVLNKSFRKYVEAANIPGTVKALEETISDIEHDIEHKTVFIALIDNEPAGSIRVELLPDNTAYITRFGVQPDYNNMGIGTALMDAVDKLLGTNGVTKVRLNTASNHVELMRFYYSRGFYVESVSNNRGYPRAVMVKNYVTK